MTKKQWFPWDDECSECGSHNCEVLTESHVGAHDGDDVKCLSCGNTGYVSGDETWSDTVWNEISTEGKK